jgi:WD40 repeat protein
VSQKVRSIEHKGEVMCVALNQSGSLLVTGQGKLIYLWDVGTGAQTSFKKGHADIVRCLAVQEERVLNPHPAILDVMHNMSVRE